MARVYSKRIWWHEEAAGMEKDAWESYTSHCRCVKNKCIFKIKPNNVYKACLVACGYSQIAGVNFSKNYSQVFNTITFCIHFNGHPLLILSQNIQCWGCLLAQGPWRTNLCGVPSRSVDDHIILNKGICGLVQKMAVEILKKLGFVWGNVDPCIYVKRVKRG